MQKKVIKQELTRAEEEVMQILWKLGKGFVKDIVEEYPDSKPAYNTVSTIVRILEKKGFVSHKAYGKTHEYHPLVARDDYRKYYLNNMLNNYFGGSFRQLASFLISSNNIDTKELEEILKITGKDQNHNSGKK